MSQPETVSIELPKKPEGKEYLAILKEPLSLTEKITAIYLLAIKKLDTYIPLSDPIIPNGFQAVYEEYKMCNDKTEKSSLWKGIVEEYPNYVKDYDRVKAENMSNKHFLTEMKNHFDSLGMTVQAEKVQLQIHKFV